MRLQEHRSPLNLILRWKRVLALCRHERMFSYKISVRWSMETVCWSLPVLTTRTRVPPCTHATLEFVAGRKDCF